ncbi:MAG TPA: DUF4097 family beta strand repeat protein [Candidatus Faecousia intestinigallinarum]|nr:DUF4097 family beta strand repeat protein [Candidatus Faecousia intestinigallinarum]
MKKIMALVLCIVFVVSLMAGCSSSGEAFSQRAYTADGAQIRGIHMDVRDREITVSPSPDDQIHLVYFENSKEYYDISVSADKVLTITSESSKEWTDFIGGKPAAEDRKISLQIPDALIGYLILSTTNEDITLSALRIEDTVSLSANGGNIIFDTLDVGKALALTAKNGNISGTVAGSYDDFSIVTEIKKGESNLPEKKENGEKTLTVSCNNGDVDIAIGQ